MADITSKRSLLGISDEEDDQRRRELSSSVMMMGPEGVNQGSRGAEEDPAAAVVSLPLARFDDPGLQEVSQSVSIGERKPLLE